MKKPKKKKVPTYSASASITKAKFYTMAFQRAVQVTAKGYIGFEYNEGKELLTCEFTSEVDCANFEQNMKKWI